MRQKKHKWSPCFCCLSVRSKPSTACGTASVGRLKSILKKSTTATTPALLNRYPLRVMTFSRYIQRLDTFFLLLLTFDAWIFFFFFLHASAFQQYFILHRGNILWKWRHCLFFLFECRSFVLDMTMETEASAVMLTSWTLSKEVYSCPFSSCLGMNCSYNIKYWSTWQGRALSFIFWILEHKE